MHASELTPESDAIKANRIQSVLGLVDREIWIVTAAAGDRAGGLAATWVSAASIDPQRPTMMIGLAPNHFTAELVDAGRAYALHLLDQTQLDLVWRFALSSGRDTNKLDGLAYQAGSTGAPILSDCLAWLECRVIARYDAGDRIFYWGDVVAGEVRETGVALREKRVFAAAADDQRAVLTKSRDTDIAELGPLREAWRRRN
jgi:flavin reductase (DIM6/NTAB) family NADH-FMN oxidoreductase RutF